MKTLMKTMIVLGLILFSFRMIVGCKGKQESQQKNNQNTIAGRYHNQDDFEEYIEIKGDGTAYWREKSSFGSHYTELAAKWKGDGEEIVFVGPLEVVVRGKITGDTILADGKVWIRKGEIKNTSKKISKDDIPAKFKPKTFYDVADRDRQFLEQPSTEQSKAITIVPDSHVTVVPDEGNEGPSHITSEQEPVRITSEQPTTEQGKAITTVPESPAPTPPLRLEPKILRGFGVWSSDWAGRHLGEDVELKPETSVYPMAAGTLKFAKYQPEIGIGYGVIIEHTFKGETFCSVYYHMRKPKAGEVLKEGQSITPDGPIGYISGERKDHLSVPHLHIGIRKGKYLTGKDPRTNKWYYPGYTTIYNRQGVRQSNPDDPIHEEIVKEWYKPSESINRKAEGNIARSKTDQARVTTTKANLKALHVAVNQFKMDTGRFPTEEEGLKALVEQPSDAEKWEPGGYLETTEVPKDGWDRDFIYQLYPESGKPFMIKSLGADGLEGGEGYDADLLSTDVE